MEQSINLFFEKVSRDDNDFSNKRREEIISIVLNETIDFSQFENAALWQEIKYKLSELITELGDRNNIEYDGYSVETKAGRGYNYDFEVHFKSNGETVYVSKVEFKNCPSMSEYPEVLSKYTKNDFVKGIGYAEFFYDGYLARVLELVAQKFGIKISIDDFTKELYVKNCFSTNSTAFTLNGLHPFDLIEKLEYSNVSVDVPKPEKSLRGKDTIFSKKKDLIVYESISEYVKFVCENGLFDAKSFLHKISEQGEKTFIFWNYTKRRFSIDSVDINNTVSVTGVTYKKSKNINTVVVSMDNSTEYHCLLRWKNHKGVLGPAWQIKYVKSK